jgi:hypothetical protein
MRRDLHNKNPDDLGGWPLVFAAALIVILGLGGL